MGSWGEGVEELTVLPNPLAKTVAPLGRGLSRLAAGARRMGQRFLDLEPRARHRVLLLSFLGLAALVFGVARLSRWMAPSREVTFQRVWWRFEDHLDRATAQQEGARYFSPLRDGSQVHEFDEPDERWDPSGVQAFYRGGTLVLPALPRRGPGSGAARSRGVGLERRAVTHRIPSDLDPREITSIEIRLAANPRGDASFRVACAGSRKTLTRLSSTTVLLAGEGAMRTYRIDPRSMRGWQRGVRVLRLGFPDEAGEVAIDRVTFVSRYHDYVAGPVGPARVTRDGVHRSGFYLVSPGTVAFDLEEAVPPLARFQARVALEDPERPATVWLFFERHNRRHTRTPLAQVRLGVESPEAVIDLPLGRIEGKRGSVIFTAVGQGRPGVVLVLTPRILAGEKEGDPPPSFLVYVVDAMREDALSALGNPKPTTPSLDALAERGALLTRFYTASDWTRPSVTSFLTGLYPVRHGNLGLWDRVRADVTTLAERFRRAGYATASILANYQAGTVSGLDRGFDAVFEPMSLEAVQLPSFPPVDSRLLSPNANLVFQRWLTQQRRLPFFVYVHVIDAHGPYQPPPEFKERFAESYRGPLTGTNFQKTARRPTQREIAYIRSLYDAEIAFNDQSIGNLIDWVDRQDSLRDRLYVLVTADHGEQFFEHGQWTHTQSVYEEEIRVPMVVVGPRGIPVGARIDTPISGVDLAPTIVDLAGLDPFEDVDGVSFAPRLREALENQEAASREGGPGEGEAVAAGGGGDRREAEAGAGKEETAASSRLLFSERLHTPIREIAAIEWPWKLIYRRYADGTIETELYRVDEDPRETRDLSGANPSRVTRLRKAVESHLRGLGESPREGQAIDPAIQTWLEELGYGGGGGGGGR